MLDSVPNSNVEFSIIQSLTEAIQNPENGRRYFPMEQRFQMDAKAMLKKESSGNCGAHLFAGKGADILQDFNKAANYYPFYEDYDLVLNHAGYYHDLAHSGMKRPGPVVLVELGAGGPKTLSLLKSAKPDIFVPIDYALEPLIELITVIKNLQKTGDLENFDVQPRVVNFNEDDFRLPQAGRIIIAEFGGTFGNMSGFYDAPAPTERFSACLEHYARQLQTPEDRIIISVDHNSDIEELRSCYEGKYHEDLGRFLLERIQNELPVSKEFSPDNFRPCNLWLPHNRLLAVGYEVIKTNSFSLDGKIQTWVEDEKMIHTNSFRFTTGYMNEIRNNVRHRLRQTDDIYDRRKARIHQHVFAPEL